MPGLSCHSSFVHVVSTHVHASPDEVLNQAHRYLVDRVQPNDEAGEARAKAEAVRSECWDKLSSGGGWPNQGWREAYVFSLMLVSMHIIDASSGGASSPDDLCEAMRHLDMALIMGGPGAGDIVLPMVDTVEPSLKRAMPPLSPEEEADESSWIIGGDLPTSSPVIDDVKAIKRVAKIPFAEFKKSFFKTDTPVIITVCPCGQTCCRLSLSFLCCRCSRCSHHVANDLVLVDGSSICPSRLMRGFLLPALPTVVHVLCRGPPRAGLGAKSGVTCGISAENTGTELSLSRSGGSRGGAKRRASGGKRASCCGTSSTGWFPAPQSRFMSPRPTM